jgi:hypothetical protein
MIISFWRQSAIDENIIPCAQTERRERGDASKRHPSNSVAISAGLAFEASYRNAPCDPKSGHEFSKNKARAAVRFLSTRMVARND